MTTHRKSEEEPLAYWLGRKLLPGAAQLALSAGGAPPLAAQLTGTALSAGVTAYEAPEGEKLLRVLLHTGGDLLGTHVASKHIHPRIDAAAQPLANAALGLGPADSTWKHRAALFATDPDLGPTATALAGGFAGNRLGSLVSDALAPYVRDSGLP